jgi:hypothetical protein
LLCYLGVHCGIYKSSYNISNISYKLLFNFMFILYLGFFCSFQIYNFLLEYYCCTGGHCDIYKSAYNILPLNSPPAIQVIKISFLIAPPSGLHTMPCINHTKHCVRKLKFMLFVRQYLCFPVINSD